MQREEENVGEGLYEDLLGTIGKKGLERPEQEQTGHKTEFGKEKIVVDGVKGLSEIESDQ